ncbi:uncharacterized protein LOC120894632 [Anopheles arabiensis]|uniref:uncharacterized protein LOC120894632 n=1 Tax=Anopheles arabiensis TaxID=7173 RepID=UPI001AACD78F|nr:uncharacterized protein LOC120894632 [Anopheles arabiensis]
MAGFTIYSLLILGTSLLVLGSQHSPYSLQAAIDALHRREAQLALREEAAAEQLDDDGYWMEPTEEQQQQFRPNRQRLNRILANYLRRDEEPDDGYDPYDLDTRKRSVFRERDELSSYPTVFREREQEKAYPHPDLSEDFLKAVQRLNNDEREEEFQERLQRLWNKYQQEENEIEQQLFDEEPLGPYEKRQGFPMSESEPSPAHYGPPMQERKRTLPILPWLPATRKKRFPVAKRSPKPDAAPTGTDEKVAKDLQALFGAPIEPKRKRSSEPAKPASSTASSSMATTSSTTTVRPAVMEVAKTKRDSSDEHHEHSSEEGPDDDEHEHEHEHEHDHEDSSEEFEGEDDDKKKKRSVRKRSNLEVVKEDQILPAYWRKFKTKSRSRSKAKRVAVKKERAEYDHSQHSMEGNEKVAHEEVENNLGDVEGDSKKKKRTQKRYQEVFRGPEEPEMEDDYSRGLVVESTECPLLDAFERRCRGVDVLSGDIYQELLPACGAHQLCYLCGVSPKVCDLQYLSEADNICENQPDCQTTARSVLMILRGFPGPQLGPRECAKNPCLYRAMVEVGVVVN